jgi:hypothetical protein
MQEMVTEVVSIYIIMIWYLTDCSGATPPIICPVIIPGN